MGDEQPETLSIGECPDWLWQNPDSLDLRVEANVVVDVWSTHDKVAGTSRLHIHVKPAGDDGPGEPPVSDRR